MKCRRCSNELDEDSVFCDKCGTKVENEELEQTAVQDVDEIEKTILADNIINSELINSLKKEEPNSIDISDLAPDDLDDLMPKNNYAILVTIIVIIISIIIGVFIYFDLTKKDKEEVEETLNYQRIINEYGKTIEAATADYLMEHNNIESFDDIKELVKYNKHKVSCNSIYINIDGSVYLAECTVDGKKVEEMYGMKKNILTKENDDACHTTYSSKNNSISFYVENELVSIYECEEESCSLYKTKSFSYNSCLDKLAVIKDGDKIHLYNYQSAQDVYDPFSEIGSIIKDDKVIGFIAKDYESKKYGYIDVRGNTKIKFNYDTLGIMNDGKVFTNSYNSDNDVIIASKADKFGALKLSNGNTVLDFKYDKVYVGAKDKFIVREQDYYYYVTKDRMRVIDESYKMIFAFNDILVVNKDDKLYFVDLKGKKIIDDSIPVSLMYNENPSSGGVHGYNAYKFDDYIIVEVNEMKENGYTTIKYRYSIKDKRIEKE